MSSPNDKKNEKTSKATVKRQGTKVTQESGLEISEHHHTSSEMITQELKEVKVISERSQTKSKKKEPVKTKRLVKVKRTPSSSSDSSQESRPRNQTRTTSANKLVGGSDSAVGSMIQYDAGNVFQPFTGTYSKK